MVPTKKLKDNRSSITQAYFSGAIFSNRYDPTSKDAAKLLVSRNLDSGGSDQESAVPQGQEKPYVFVSPAVVDLFSKSGKQRQKRGLSSGDQQLKSSASFAAPAPDEQDLSSSAKKRASVSSASPRPVNELAWVSSLFASKPSTNPQLSQNDYEAPGARNHKRTPAGTASAAVAARRPPDASIGRADEALDEYANATAPPHVIAEALAAIGCLTLPPIPTPVAFTPFSRQNTKEELQVAWKNSRRELTVAYKGRRKAGTRSKAQRRKRTILR
eukprot:GHVS01046017.1.p1 GENE.GHVS01046017.1~~GHVS01046017.1.p1  ORF type:complete len:272 (-),score=30.16 GHVS01046017.1:231-1046(-)